MNHEEARKLARAYEAVEKIDAAHEQVTALRCDVVELQLRCTGLEREVASLKEALGPRKRRQDGGKAHN